MKILYLLFLFIAGCLALSSVVHADGPPIQNGEIYVPHQTILLEEKQVETAGRLRWIELNKKQVQSLSKKNGGPVPPVFEIITDPYHDCTCGLGFYGLWVARNKVQIPDRVLGESNYEAFEGEEEVKIKTLEDVKKTLRYTSLMIDYDGQIYQMGKLANNLNLVHKNILAHEKKNNDGEKYLWVNTPPLKNLSEVKKAYIKIEKFFQNKGFTIYAHFAQEYIEYEKRGLDEFMVCWGEVSGKQEELSKDADKTSGGFSWKVKTSSFGTWRDQKYVAGHLADGDKNTAWVEGVAGPGIKESIIFYDFKKGSAPISGFRIENGYIKSEKTFEENCRIKDLRLVQNGKSLFLLRLKDTGMIQRVLFPPIRMTVGDELTLVIEDVYGGSKYQDTALTSIAPLMEAQ